MTLAASPAPAGVPGDALAPLVLPEDLSITPEQFEQVCQTNPEAVLELAPDGRIIPMTPTGGEAGRRNARLLTRLQIWVDRSGQWCVLDSSTGFRLPDSSVHSPDASLLRLERWQALTPEQRHGFPPLCPDLVMELASARDEGPRGVTNLRRRMASYQANGARLGWLLAAPAGGAGGGDLACLRPAPAPGAG